MKKLSFALCALMAMPAMAQKYTVSGTVPAGVKKVYLQHIGTAMRPDSVEVKMALSALKVRLMATCLALLLPIRNNA